MEAFGWQLFVAPITAAAVEPEIFSVYVLH
jgi:hypothetical protein